MQIAGTDAVAATDSIESILCRSRHFLCPRLLYCIPSSKPVATATVSPRASAHMSVRLHVLRCAKEARPPARGDTPATFAARACRYIRGSALRRTTAAELTESLASCIPHSRLLYTVHNVSMTSITRDVVLPPRRHCAMTLARCTAFNSEPNDSLVTLEYTTILSNEYIPTFEPRLGITTAAHCSRDRHHDAKSTLCASAHIDTSGTMTTPLYRTTAYIIKKTSSIEQNSAPDGLVSVVKRFDEYSTRAPVHLCLATGDERTDGRSVRRR